MIWKVATVPVPDPAAWGWTPFLVTVGSCVLVFAAGALALWLYDGPTGRPARQRAVGWGLALGLLVGCGLGAPVAYGFRAAATRGQDRDFFEQAFAVTLLETQTASSWLFTETTSTDLPTLPRASGAAQDLVLWRQDARLDCTVYVLTDGWRVQCTDPDAEGSTFMLAPAVER